MLYEVCLGENKRSYFVSSADEINPMWFTGCESIGVCGATSTPKWLIRQVAETIGKICKEHGYLTGLYNAQQINYLCTLA